MTKTSAHTFVVLFFGILSIYPLSAQEAKKTDVWQPFKFFLGYWKGPSTGQSGEGKVTRQYTRILSGKFIQAENQTIYPPTEQNPEGEIHQDWGIFSYDSGRKKFVLRQFHLEGFVNQYVLDSISKDGKYISFVTEEIENIPAGWRAKEIYRVVSDDEFTETFQLAEPGKDFQTYSENRLKRALRTNIGPIEKMKQLEAEDKKLNRQKEDQ
ncbi:MAG: hypothetical protein A2Z27_01360 [candidate division Zixibacteria bacterium RBG_16_50_21]|nr:MAG: hypothetical protein A2Z27_01360 [candidate division Zixibacteria bacterium RBG_16_50_21]